MGSECFRIQLVSRNILSWKRPPFLQWQYNQLLIAESVTNANKEAAIYRKYPNLMRTQVKIISDPNYVVRILFGR